MRRLIVMLVLDVLMVLVVLVALGARRGRRRGVPCCRAAAEQAVRTGGSGGRRNGRGKVNAADTANANGQRRTDRRAVSAGGDMGWMLANVMVLMVVLVVLRRRMAVQVVLVRIDDGL